jgi:hypothetical protein
VPRSLRSDALAICICIALAGCSHHRSDATTDNAGSDEQTQSIGGVWNGTDASGHSVLALADEAGEFHIIVDDGTQYAGTATTTGDAVSASAERLLRHAGSGGSVGNKSEAITLKGKIQQRQSLTVTVAPAGADRSFAPQMLELQFNSIYSDPSSLAMIAGDYMDPVSGNSITIAGSGTLFWNDAKTGCLVEGAVSIIDARYDLYEAQFSFSACQGANADLNGIEFLGLGTLDTSMQPAQLMIGVTGEAAGRGYAIDLKLSRLPPRSPI